MPIGATPTAAAEAFDAATERNREITNAVAREWRAFLSANLVLEQQRQQATDVLEAFERGDAELQAAEQAEETLQALEPAWQQVFQAYVQEYRHQVAQRLAAEHESQRTPDRVPPPQPTPQEIALLAWEELQQRALGIVPLADAPGPGYGEVPLPDGQVAYVDVRALADVPNARTTWQQSGMNRTRWGALAALAVLFVLVLTATLFSVLDPAAAGDIAPPAVVQANGVAIAPWRPTRLDLTLSDGTVQALPVVVVATLPRNPTTNAAWSTGAVLPAVACVPAAVLPTIEILTVHGGNQVPERTYTVVADDTTTGASDDSPADLLLTGCGEPTPVRRGILHQVAPPEPLEIGTAAQVSLANGRDVTLTVRAITLVGPATLPDLPPDRARVTVVLETDSTGITWNQLTPELVLETGEVPSRGPLTETATTVTFAYLVSLPQRTLPVEWRVTAAGQQQRWRTMLDPPPTRAETLYRSLHVQAITADQPRPGTLVVTLTVHHQGESPLWLHPGDIQVTQDTTQRAATFDRDTEEANNTPLRPGDTRTVVVVVTTGGRPAPVTITLGAARYILE